MDGSRRQGRFASVAAAAVLVTLAATACSGGSGSVAVFSTGGPDQVCLVHQTRQPTGAYEGGENTMTELELDFLRYYTAHGNQAFCDGKPATDLDRTWAQLYARLTNNPTNVNGILGTS